MSDEIAALLATKFIARRDVKAIQCSSGAYVPVENAEHERLPWKMPDIRDHLARERTYGHYLLDSDSNCKLFCFDIDLEKNGWLPTDPDPWTSPKEWQASFKPCDPRAAWRDRAHPGRAFMKLQFKTLAHQLMKVIHEDLELPCAAAYSGGKGIHIYGFTGLTPAYDARTGAQIVLDTLGEFEPVRGNVFFKHKNTDPIDGFGNLSIEVFPKQDTLDGKDLGNLLRLPLGRNQKSKDPTFFIDMTTAIGDMTPLDPMWALGQGSLSPWRRVNE